jgi:Tfp pilus assembly protein PilO
MTTRDRLMLMGIVVLAVLLGAWFTTVAPERERAAKVSAEVESARQQLAAAESQANSASNARAQYSAAYASLISLGQAVPASAETPALMYMLDKATHVRNVQFASITTTAGGSASSAGAASAAQSTAFTQEPFTFVFTGSFVDLYELLNQLEDFTAQTPTGSLRVNGRLLTIDSLSLAPLSQGAQGGSGRSKSPQLTGTVTATAYVLPVGQSTVGGATSSGPAASGSTTSASGTTATPGATTAAVIKANP